MRANPKKPIDQSTDQQLNSSPQVRTVKIHPRKRYKRKRDVPEIRLYGNWLADMGFHQGNSVRIVMMERCLVITIDN